MERNWRTNGSTRRLHPTHRRLAAVVVMSVAGLTACGSDGPSALDSDSLASEADSICRKATRDIGKLDTSDPEQFLSDAIDSLSTASDDLEALVPNADVKDDYDDFTSSVSKQVRQAKKVLTAVKGGDATEISGAMAKFTDLTADSDDLADGLDATKCVGLGQAAMAAVSATPPSTTTVSETTLVVVTTTPTDATTLPPVTLPPTTVPPITTVPVTAPPTTVPPVTAPPVTTPPATTAPGATADGNMIDNWTAPPGFEFQRDAGDILVAIWPSPKFDPVIGPTFVRYDVGALGGPSATTFPIIMALELSEKFTDEQIDAYITFEGNDAGSTVDSPGGYTMWVVPASGDITFDSTMVFLGKYAINMRTDPGVDAVGILDTFIEANFD